MVFASLAFLWLFFPLVLVLYFASRSVVWRDGVLVLVSLVFYGWGEPRFVALMLAVIASGFLHGRVIQYFRDRGRPGAARGALVSGVGLCLASLGVFKYLGFAVSNLNQALGLSLPAMNLVLPIGISFYTFQMVSYLVDVYRGATNAERSLLRLGTYITMFSQLIAGPIVRYVTVAGELAERQVTVRDFSDGMRRFVVGLGKKVLLANPMGQIADACFAQSPDALTTSAAWMGVVAYAFQIYFDFSGYSDMAIGLGRTFGFHFLENFNYPYVSRSVTEFWRRWHISLSSFFRDYVYIPLGGNRVSQPRWALNLLIVWMLTGFWHGAAWNFMFWGLYFGVLLWLEKTVLARFLTAAPPAIGWVYTALAVLGGWVLFRVESMASVPGWCGALLGLNEGALLGAHQLEVFWLLPLFIPAAIGSTPWVGRWLFGESLLSKHALASQEGGKGRTTLSLREGERVRGEKGLVYEVGDCETSRSGTRRSVSLPVRSGTRGSVSLPVGSETRGSVSLPGQAKARSEARGWLGDVFLMAVLVASLISLVSDTFNPFIYFRF